MHRLLCAALILLGIAACLALSATAPADAQQLLANGGFESGSGGWQVSGGLSTTSDSHSGSRAGLLTTSGNPALAYQTVPVAAGGTYQASAWLKAGDGLNQAHIRVTWYDANGTSIGFHPSGSIAGDATDWQTLSIGPLTAPGSAASARFAVSLTSSGADASVLIDDALLDGAAPPPPPPPPGSPSPTPSSTPGAPGPPSPPPPNRPPPSTGGTNPTPEPTPPPAPGSESTPPAPPAGAPEPGVFPSLVNGSFEDLRADGTPYGWLNFRGAMGSATLAMDGARGIVLSGQSTAVKWGYQAVAVQGGSAYQMTAFAYKNDPSITELYLRVSWYETPDASGPLLESIDSIESLTTDAPWFRALNTGPVLAPTTARSARVRLMVYPSGSAPATAYFDAVSFYPTTMPPPSELPPRARATSRAGNDPDGPGIAPGGSTGAGTGSAAGTQGQTLTGGGGLHNDRPLDSSLESAASAGGGSPLVIVGILGGTTAIGAIGAACWGLRRKIAPP